MKGILYAPLNILNDSTELKEIYFNRAFLYGDGFFESMRWHKDKIYFYDDHFTRIRKSFEILKLNDDRLEKDLLQKQIETLIKDQNINNDARIRLTFFRIAEGFYTPEISTTGLLIQAKEWENNSYLLNETPITMGFYHDHYKNRSSLSNIKSLNSLVYVLAGIHVKENNWDDAVLLNDTGNVCEATSSNIFMVSNDVIYTPRLSEGCVGGVMRQQAIRLADKGGIKLIEKPISKEELLEADEVFLTNGIRGFITVGKCENKIYKTEIVNQFAIALNNI
jgi:branched-chain amino acid aminotransferase